MAPTLTTEQILEAIKKRVLKLCPREGWPRYGGLALDLTIHDNEVVDTEGTLKDTTREDSDES